MKIKIIILSLLLYSSFITFLFIQNDNEGIYYYEKERILISKSKLIWEEKVAGEIYGNSRLESTDDLTGNYHPVVLRKVNETCVQFWPSEGFIGTTPYFCYSKDGVLIEKNYD